MIRRSAAWGAPLILVFLIISFYWKLVFTDQYTWLDNQDAANMILPWFQFQAAQWHQGHFPMWDPYLWGGQTIVGQVVPAATYPPNWILFLLPLKDGFLRQSFLHWYWVLLHVHAGVFCYFLCRDLRRSHAASILGGLAFALAGYAGVQGFPEVLAGLAWAPAVFLFQFRALRGEKWFASAGLSGACLGAAWLSGHHQAPIFITLGAALLWIVGLYNERRSPRRALTSMAVFGTLFVLTAGLQLLPAYEYGKLARRWVEAEEPLRWDQPVPYYIHKRFSLQPASLLGIVLPGIRDFSDPYEGFVAVTLAFVAILTGWRSRPLRRLGLLALAGVLLALGHYSFFHGVAYALLPLVEKARAPAAAFGLCSLAIAVMAAYGLDEYPKLGAAPWPLRLVGTLMAFAFLLLSLTIASLLFRPESAVLTKLGLAPWVALALAATLFAWVRNYLRPSNAAAVLILLMLFELGNFISIELPNKYQKNDNSYLSKLTQHADIAAFLQRMPGPFRIGVDTKDIPYNFGDWYGIEQFEGHVGSLPENFLRQEWASAKVHDLYGVRYYVARSAQSAGQKEVFRGASGVAVFQNPQAYPRAWTVHSIVAPGQDFDPHQSASAPTPHPAVETCAKPDIVTVVEAQANSTLFKVDMACRGLLVVGDNYFPGWKAEIDGQTAPILEVDTSLRGIVVGPGAHSVRMDYRPASVMVGGAMTAVGALIAVLLWWRARRHPVVEETDTLEPI